MLFLCERQGLRDRCVSPRFPINPHHVWRRLTADSQGTAPSISRPSYRRRRPERVLACGPCSEGFSWGFSGRLCETDCDAPVGDGFASWFAATDEPRGRKTCFTGLLSLAGSLGIDIEWSVYPNRSEYGIDLGRKDPESSTPLGQESSQETWGREPNGQQDGAAKGASRSAQKKNRYERRLAPSLTFCVSLHYGAHCAADSNDPLGQLTSWHCLMEVPCSPAWAVGCTTAPYRSWQQHQKADHSRSPTNSSLKTLSNSSRRQLQKSRKRSRLRSPLLLRRAPAKRKH